MSLKESGTIRRIAVTALLLATAGAPVSAFAGNGPAEVALTLREAIERALRGNPSLVDARLDRILQRTDAEEAGRRFQPQWRVRTTGGYAYRQEERERTANAAAATSVEMNLRTGGRLQAGPRWERRLKGGGADADSSALVVSLVQPLGRGAGPDLARMPIDRARLAEESNLLRFRGVLMDVVTEVVTAYRALVSASLAEEIERRSLEEARRTREVVRVLIETGRVARSDLTQSDADVADREIQSVRSRVALEDAQAALAVLLGLDAGIRVRPADPLPAAPGLPDLDGSLDRALAGNTGYRDALLALRVSELDRKAAEDTRRWDVAAEAHARFEGDGRSAGSSLEDLAGGLDSRGEYSVMLSLAVPLGGAEERKDRRARLAARIGRVKAAYAAADARRELDIAVRRTAERVRAGHRRMRLAADALALAREKVRIEEGKLRLGLTSTYHMGRVRSELVAAETREVGARIDYLNALSELDRIEGSVLGTWNVEFDDGADAIPVLPEGRPEGRRR